MSLRAVIYARVSSEKQRDMHTIESQLRALREYVERSGWKLVKTYTDDGRSAKTGMLDRRDAFADLMRDAEAGKFDIIVVVDVNRLTRTESIEERATIIGPFQRLGIRIATPSGGVLDLRSFLGEFWVTVQSLVAAEENRKRTEAIVRGKQRAMAEGRKPAGPTPFGHRYSRADREWSLDTEAAKLVREIYRRVTRGESCVQIADDFVERDAQPAPRKGWSRAAVYRIVRKRTAVGEWCADKRQRVVIRIPPIVTEAQWQAASDALLAHKRRGLRRTRHVYLLEGLGTCGVCGSPIHIRSACGEPGKKNQPAYVCRSRKLDGKYRRDMSGARCDAPIIATPEADARVWAIVERALQRPSLVVDIQRRLDARESNRRNWEADAKEYRQRLDRLSTTESAILARFRRGTISETAMDRELAAIARDRDALESQLKTARAASVRSEGRVSAEVIAAGLRRLAESSAPEDRQRVVRAILPEAVFRADGKIRVVLEIDEPAESDTVLALRSVYRKQHEERREILRIVRVA